MNIDINEVARYMGINCAPDIRVTELIKICAGWLEPCVSPRYTSLILQVSTDGQLVRLDGLEIKSADLARHLGGCQKAVIFAATLGAEVDRLMTRRARADSVEGLCLQAVASAMIENFCDKMEEEISAKAEKTKYFPKPRFSPGYGDFDISYQTDILRLLQAGKKIGLGETATHMLTPLKSVTAVIGLCGEKTDCSANKCSLCNKTGCAFRK